MNTITANQLKTKGVSVIESSLANENELVITVRGKEKYVVMDMQQYNYLRECELDAALHEARADYKNGKYEVSLNSHEEISTGFASSYIKLIGDYQVSVDAALISGDKELACYGLIFGYEYWWELCEDQYFQIFKYVEEEVSIIEEWKYSSSISSTSDNHLSVDVTGNQVQLFINDTLVSSFNATAPTDGFLDLFVNTYEASSGTFTFDSLEIRMP